MTMDMGISSRAAIEVRRPLQALLAALALCACAEGAAGDGPVGQAVVGGSGGQSLAGNATGAVRAAAGAGGDFASGGGLAPASASGLPCDVQQIVVDKCSTCHGAAPSFGAPMALTSAAQFHAAGVSDKTKQVFQLVKTRINASTAAIRMPPTTSPALSPGELAALNGWLDSSAPAASAACNLPAAAGASVATVDTAGLTCHKFTAHAQGNKEAKFKVGAVTDAYYAFGFAAPWTQTVYGEVFLPVVDNPRAIHHWLLYEEPTTDDSFTTTIGQHAKGKLLAGWAPGGPPYDFRKYGDVGFELPPATYILEVHYNSADANAEDGSGLQLCVQSSKPQNVAGMSWLGYDHGGVLAATAGACIPSAKWTGKCAPQNKEPIHLLFVTPHLHQSGTHLKAVIDGPRGPRVLLDQAFDFNYQITYPTPEVLMPGETITTTCDYSKPQCFGQATSKEMCYLFTYSYPKGALADTADWGRLAHGEGTCLGQSTADIF